MNEEHTAGDNRDSAVIPINHGGRPTKYEPETVDKLLKAIADGLTQKQACKASGICEKTLATWRDKYPELEPRLEQARESARQSALAGIKKAGQAGDWRAWEAFLRMSFPADYRQSAKVEVNATATANNAEVVVTEEQRARLIALREKLQTQPLMQSVTTPQLNAVGTNNNLAPKHDAPGERVAPWSVPAGTIAPSDADPAFRAFLEHQSENNGEI